MRKRPRPPRRQRTPPAATLPQTPAPPVPLPSPWLAGIAAVWLLLAAGEVALSALTGGTDPRLTAFGLVALAGGVAFVRLLLWPGPAAYRALVISLAVLFWVGSWATFWQTGLFLNRDALVFWASQPVQVFHWVYPPLVIALLLASAVLAVVVGRVVPRWVSTWSPAMQRHVVRTVAAVLAVCAALAGSGWVSGAWGALGRTTSPFAGESSGHAGPIVHAVVDALSRPAAPAGRAGSDAGDPLRVIRRPIISMDDYVATVDAARARRFNVVMIQVESLRADQLRVYGGRRDVMPTLDALARDARVFTNAYIQASHSNYAGLVPLSSQYPLRSREMYTYPEDPPYPRVLVYDILKALGYRTAIFSSQNERWGAMINHHRPESLDRFFHAETFGGPTYTPWEDIGFAEWVKETDGAGSVDDRFTMDEALAWMDTVAGEPFFLHMNLQSSHLPYVVPAGFDRPFGPETLDFTILWGRLPLDRIDVVKDRYADSLFYIDTQIARLFDRLRDRGLWDRTVIVIGGDNGEAFYEHGFSAHASWLFDEVVKVPMIVRVPGRAPGADARPAMFLDTAPTVLDALGLPPHPGFQGISLFTPDPDPDRSIFMVAQTPVAYETAIVRGRFKLHWAEREDLYVLNDLAADPGETTDIAASRPDVVEQLARRLQQWRNEQLAYYADVARQAREYPPFFEE